MQRRHTRDGTRRRSYVAPYVSVYSPGNTGRDQYNRPRSDENVAARELEAESAYNNAAAAAANSNVTAYLAAVQEAALAAALARSGSNSTGSNSADMEDAASAENWAALTLGFSTFGCYVSECRTRGNTAEICGHSEITSASTPPKKYRVCTFTGTLTGDTYNGTVCGGAVIGTFEVATSGVAEYSASNCALISNGVSAVTETPPGTTTYNNLSSPPYGSANTCLQTVSENQVSITRTATGVCCATSPTLSQIHAGWRTAALSVEDTEADAITRLQNVTSWSNWSSANSSSCLARYEERTANFSFYWQEAQFRATVNIAENVSGTVKVGVYRRAYGTADPWVQLSTEYFSVTGNVAGQDSIEMDVPNEVGYETYAACLAAGS